VVKAVDIINNNIPKKQGNLKRLVVSALISGFFIVFALLGSAVLAGPLSFAPAANFGAGTGPVSVTTGYFNADSNLDLAVANYGTDNVSILLGTGTGTFGAAANFGAGTGPISVTTGYFNADSNLDLAVANYGTDNVSILLGTGTGTFGAAANFGAGTNPISVTTGYFNADSNLDLAVANYGTDNVSILLGTGTGTFGAAANFGAGTGPYSVTTGYFNADSNLDLAVANGGTDNVSILLGTGTGTFSAAANFGAGTNPRSVTTGDFNADSNLDLAVANYITDNVSILLGTGTGTFSAAANFGAGTDPYSVTTGDFNGDSKLDLAVANNGTNNVSILINTTLSPAKAITTFTISGQSGTTTINESSHTIALTMPYGTDVTALEPTITITGASVSPASGVPHDFTTNPSTYTVTAEDASTQAYAVTVTVALNPAKAITAFTIPGQTGATTINESAHTIALTMPYGTDVTALVPTITITGASVAPASGAANDFTAPATYTVTAADTTTQAYTVTVSVALNPASFTESIGWNSGPGFGMPDTNKVVSGDFDSDGNDDVAILCGYYVNRQAILWVSLSNGTTFGNFTNWWDSGPGNWDVDGSKLSSGDYNNDNIDDVSILYGYQGTRQSKAWVFISNGTTTFNSPTMWWDSGPNNWDWNGSKLTSGDFNNDGASDLGVLYGYQSTRQSKAWVFISDATATNTFNSPTVWWDSGPNNWDWDGSKLTSGDYNDDGASDFGVLYGYQDTRQTKTWVFISNGSTAFNLPAAWWDSGPNNWDWDASMIASSDYNGDGPTDICIFYGYQSTRQSKAWVFISNGATAFNSPADWWNSGPANWDWDGSILTSGYYSGGTSGDLAIFYYYYEMFFRLFKFTST